MVLLLPLLHTRHSAGIDVIAAQTPAPQAPPAPRPPNPQNLEQQIEQTVEQAVQEALEAVAGARTGAEAGAARDLARERAREALARVRDELEAARAGARPEVRVQFPMGPPDTIPPQAVDMAYAFFATIAFIAVGLPLARAFARRMDRRSAPAPADLGPRLDRIEQAVEAVAIEVERISENQRYATKVITELRGLPASQPAGWQGSNARQAEPVPRTGEPPRP
ncbi:MAG TPA: hypothetical protein VLE53_17755 [Gemmatimonadaceae bacterium]|nr:hypothetical protein [Gemmatimonadaceae bacterium]